ncbi:LuxR family transcriptional regulator [Actinacidiphila acididurans]|uniref:LuxR family transcriptional regulator n=1 Tax=Actinacidiphila acididurans TaxID=2784346 RepID=UPI0027DC6AB1|nr:LuxR family transcriptional regulator [Actinacidiphila acididurans]
MPDRVAGEIPAEPAAVAGPGWSRRRPVTAPAGREELLAAAREALAKGQGVVLTGPAGIGKSTLLAAVAPDAPGPGAVDGDVTVLRCAPAPEDAGLPYLGLIDLLAPVPAHVLAALPPGPRTALRAALLHGASPAASRDALAVRVAVLETLRRLARRGPVLLVVDGLQWLDEPSADVLAFAARRVAGTGIRFVAAERVPEGGQGERPRWPRCCPPDTAEIAVPPLGDDDVALLLLASGAALSPPDLRAVLRTAAGNPLYALALGREAAAAGGSAESGGFLPVPQGLRDLLLGPVRALPAAVRQVLLVAATAEQPHLTLLQATVGSAADAESALGHAERLGVLTVDPSRIVRFTHPVLRAAVHADASGDARRRAHALLAAVVTEPVERARHLALAHPYEDEAVAARLMAASDTARAQGDPGAAAELAALAARRTPADRPGDRDRRLLAAARFACDAGRREEAELAARTVLAGSRSARLRVLARLTLLGNAGQALRDRGGLIEDGLRDAAGDPALEAALHHWAAQRELLCGALDAAAGYARRSARCAERAGDDGTRIAALATLARVRSLAGAPADAEAALDRALAAADGGPRSWGLVRMRAVLALDSDRVGQARAQLTGLLAAAGQGAGWEQTVASLVALTRVQVRAGECRAALGTARRCAEVVAAAGTTSAPALYAAALAQTFGGTAESARALGEQAVRASEADGDRLFLLRALAVSGQAGLFAGDRAGAATAVEWLRRALETGAAIGAADPPLLAWHADLAEALVTLGETAAAAEVLATAYRSVRDGTPGSVLAALERAQGLRAAAEGRAKEGAALLRTSVERLRPLGLPVELARALTALGAVERRARHRAGARAALTEALRVAEGAGAAPFAARARDELARVVTAERGGTAGLTATEARIAALVTGGATNREVADALFISVKTVEGALSRIYRKVGVRSRTALAHAMAVAAAG